MTEQAGAGQLGRRSTRRHHRCTGGAYVDLRRQRAGKSTSAATHPDATAGLDDPYGNGCRTRSDGWQKADRFTSRRTARDAGGVCVARTVS